MGKVKQHFIGYDYEQMSDTNPSYETEPEYRLLTKRFDRAPLQSTEHLKGVRVKDRVEKYADRKKKKRVIDCSDPRPTTRTRRPSADCLPQFYFDDDRPIVMDVVRNHKNVWNEYERMYDDD